VDAAVEDHVATLDRLADALSPADRELLTGLLAAVEEAADGSGLSGRRGGS
jgi:hypothetical protein